MIETLLLPGMDGTGRLFDAFVREPAIQARVVSFSPDRVSGYEQLLEEVDVPTGPFAIVAESFSGPLGIRLASRHADRVGALALVATFARSPSRARIAARRPDVEVHLLDAPHLVLQSRPVESAAIISEFIVRRFETPLA